MPSKFRQIVLEITNDISNGKLKAGEKLLPLRTLAYQKGISLGTASRVYDELTAIGLTRGEIGRGTFVRHPVEHDYTDFAIQELPNDVIDFSRNYMILPTQVDLFAQAVSTVLKKQTDYLFYRENHGTNSDRYFASQFLSRSFSVSPEDTVICSGGQHGIFMSLMASCRPGDAVAIEELSYPGLQLAAKQLRLELIPVRLDEDGLVAEHLEEICETHRVAALYTMPNFQNPSSTIQSDVRRHQIARIARKFDITVIEDDAYGFLSDPAGLPLYALAPERTFHIRTFSKSWAPGLRICYLACPEHKGSAMAQLVRTTNWMATPLMIDTAAEIIQSGMFDDIVRQKRIELAWRHEKLAEMPLQIRTVFGSLHACVSLISKIPEDQIVASLMAKGVKVSSMQQFAISSMAKTKKPEIRLCLGAPTQRMQFSQGLCAVESVLSHLQE
jgi:DNA-binding transcriptional MocR family regulator